MSTTISKDNIDEATAAELQKYMEDKGVVDLHLTREHLLGHKTGWMLTARLTDGTTIAGGPFPEMSDGIKFLIRTIEEN